MPFNMTNNLRSQNSDVLSFHDFLARIPKTDLHIHLQGAIRPDTLIELAIKHVVELPSYQPEEIYKFKGFSGFLEVLRATASCVADPEDFSRVAFEMLEDAFLMGNGQHVEYFVNPTVYLEHGVAYEEMLEGLRDGMKRAREEYGITSLLIPSIDREKSPRLAMQMLKEVLRHPCQDVAGIGMDYAEGKGPPAMFQSVYQAAGNAGLKRTSHVCESNQPLELAPPANVRACLDLLGCDRLDHGYNLLADKEVVAYARDHGTYFCVTPTTVDEKLHLRRALTIRAMRNAGLRITVNTDDPYLLSTDLRRVWQQLFEVAGWGVEDARELMLNGVEASWASENRKREMRLAFTAEFDSLAAQLDRSDLTN